MQTFDKGTQILTKIKRAVKLPIGNKIALSRLKRRVLKHVWFIRFLLLAFCFLLLVIFCVFGFKILKRTQFGKYINWTEDFIFKNTSSISQVAGRTNILILGKGGAEHEAPDLTDTMIFASLSQSKKNLTLVSLSRDIWVPDLRAKLNSVYYWGNQKKLGGGLILAKSTVEEIVGQPISYAVVVDFSGFRKLIDDMGGVSVNVLHSFTDEKFPIAGREADLCGGDKTLVCRYETISFREGRQFVNGETALKFVRSRNAKGDEGTDFARAGRQQQVLSAIKQKVLSKDVLLHPKVLINLWNDVWAMIETDIPENAIPVLARIGLDSINNFSTNVLPEDLLINPPTQPKYDNLYVFISKNGDWKKVQEFIKNKIGE